MDKFTQHHKIMDLVEANYHLLPVINRFGITLGNRDKNLEAICASQGINVDFFLLIINTFHNEAFFPEKELRSFSPLLIIDYLQKTHQHYIEYVLPKLESLLDQLIESDRSEAGQLHVIKKFYRKYKEELLIHFKEEDELVFPYIIRLVKEGVTDPEYTIHIYEKEHSNVDTKLNDLKNLIIKYIDPVYDINVCNEFLIRLFRFEKDIMDHTRIEDKILVPQVVELENSVHG